MTWLLGIASLISSLYCVFIFHNSENDVLNGICFIVLSIIWYIVLCASSYCEDKLERRIKALEDKLKEKEESL